MKHDSEAKKRLRHRFKMKIPASGYPEKQSQKASCQ